jgi:CDP-diacylglycerol---glycerol-3-phosphate 3-phosphatidyltransferase
VAIRSKFPDDVEAVVRPVGRLIARTGVSANMLTTFGLLLTAAATWSVANGHPLAAALLLIGGGLSDLLDGAVARATDRVTPFGGFYDSISDRISDGLILGGIAWWVSDNPRLFVLAIVALVAAEVTSYVRARAEAIDLTCTIGIFERAERTVLLILALLLHQWLLEPVLWVLAVGSTFTVIQRVHHVWCQIDRDIPEELLVLALADRAWSRAFKGAARRFYGERNFDGAVDGRGPTETPAVPPAAPGTEEPAGGDGHVGGDGHLTGDARLAGDGSRSGDGHLGDGHLGDGHLGDGDLGGDGREPSSGTDPDPTTDDIDVRDAPRLPRRGRQQR